MKQQFTIRHVAPLGHNILIPINKSFFLQFNAAWVSERQKILILLFVVHNTYAADAVVQSMWFLSGLHLYKIANNIEATEPGAPGG